MKQTLPLYIKSYCICIALLSLLCVSAQNVDLENYGSRTLNKIKKSPLKVSGAIAANGVYYTSSQDSGREPFTYFLQGSLNVGWLSFNMPVSYSFSNQGEQLDFETPFKFNRLSLHPKYKWVQAHIGDVSMTFSPYTLSGHQFTGGGVDLTPKGDFKISAMSGRLLKATEDNDDQRTIPAFRRMGYGLKMGYEKEKYKIGLIGFYAKDDINSISAVPDDKDVTPKENLVLSLEGAYKLSDKLELRAEYASTAITQDLRADEIEGNGSGLAGALFANRGSTEYYTAVKAGLDYSFGKSTVGIEYERIDPGYETLGAYFFNNDFENITLNSTTTLFKDKMNLAFNVGYQRDDLEDQKEQSTNRTVGSVNATYNATEKLTITASYSNFSTFTNAKVNQFDNINDDNLLDNVTDELDYRQLSQNANINVNYALSKTETLSQNINVNYALADVSNEQGGVVRIGDASTFHNANAAYTLGFPQQKMNITAVLNGTVNTIGREDATTWGPTLSVNKKFFDNKLNSTVGASYNTSDNQAGTSSVTNFRANANYIYREKHNFNLSAIQVFRSTEAESNYDLTVTFGYNYAFDLNAPKFKKREKEKTPKIFSFAYRTHTFSGEHMQISKDVVAVSRDSVFQDVIKIEKIKQTLDEYNELMVATEGQKNKRYKESAIDYLAYLYKHKDFLEIYHKLAIRSLRRLYKEAVVLNLSVEKEYKTALALVNTARESNETLPQEKHDDLAVKDKKYKAHNWMLEQLEVLTIDDVINNRGLLEDFKNKELSNVFEQLDSGKDKKAIEEYLEVKFADLYHKKSYEIEDYEYFKE